MQELCATGSEGGKNGRSQIVQGNKDRWDETGLRTHEIQQNENFYSEFLLCLFYLYDCL